MVDFGYACCSKKIPHLLMPNLLLHEFLPFFGLMQPDYDQTAGNYATHLPLLRIVMG